MKLLSPLALFTVCSLLATPLLAAEQQPGLTGCAAKKQAISEQIEQARAHGNSNQQAGLEKALSEVTEHCTDASLRKEREQKVLDARHEVNQRTKDLDKAMKKGDAEKINKRKDKLAESKQELQDALKELEK
ncbi:DUF1090 domain-containing protein [Pseudomonas sp. NPDC087612]|uniref:DUF1090 domain-containing protein n=1 Tax=Pseudomonas vranovensis TaxID=321661 RepID=A0A423DY88_9PSED|nr:MULTISPECIES: DUF1090 domain-containing protein [Pseudomonas]KJK19861.1 hypothetical protein UB48_02025 [Pseudomonas sp. 2(2015)]QPG64905.1 DUF1090 domain-containing protein [Pseudomonas sp. BIGb0427]QVM96352.1 DUF1090 domain-containing protein [Pseudomonas sp. SORT22]ROL77394.1 hypothetical protein BHU25_04240 [Pseudomonas vranovensis]UVL56784.1 DUF1090 domain-containing protein [Pseudomonas sp. B21-035]